MGGETDLTTLLRSMRPQLSDVEYAFGILPAGQPIPDSIRPDATIREDEGLTIVAPAAEVAAAGLRNSPGWAKISLEVHSSLSAVGLTARVAAALADEGISANVGAGYFHDHVFVQFSRRYEAMAAVIRLARS